MKFYFSGLKSQSEVRMLQEASVTTVLVDQFDVGQAATFSHVALDSGAFRAWKRDLTLDLETYVTVAQSRAFDSVTALAVFADAQASYDNWLRMRNTKLGGPLVPVWPWGSDRSLLQEYLAQAEWVGIGGLVPLLRRRNRGEEPPPVKREQTLRDLADLAAAHPGRFHAFGLCWAKAQDVLWEVLASADTSHWLARRRGLATYISRWGYLQEAPFRSLGYEPNEACIESARAIQRFQPARWFCQECGAAALHHEMRPVQSRRRRCSECKGQVKAKPTVREYPYTGWKTDLEAERQRRLPS